MELQYCAAPARLAYFTASAMQKSTRQLLRAFTRAALLLLAHPQVDPHIPDSKGVTPLAAACAVGLHDVVRALLSRPDVDVNAPDNSGRTPLQRACEAGCTRIVGALLAHPRISVDDPGKAGDSAGPPTPLQVACAKRHTDVVRTLLKHPKTSGLVKDFPALHAAIEGKNPEILSLLLSASGFDPNAASQGQTPLRLAVDRGFKAGIELLLSHRAIDLSLHDDQRRTVFSLACQRGDVEIVRLLLEHPCRTHLDGGSGAPRTHADPGEGSTRSSRVAA